MSLFRNTFAGIAAAAASLTATPQEADAVVNVDMFADVDAAILADPSVADDFADVGYASPTSMDFSWSYDPDAGFTNVTIPDVIALFDSVGGAEFSINGDVFTTSSNVSVSYANSVGTDSLRGGFTGFSGVAADGSTLDSLEFQLEGFGALDAFDVNTIAGAIEDGTLGYSFIEGTFSDGTVVIINGMQGSAEATIVPETKNFAFLAGAAALLIAMARRQGVRADASADNVQTFEV